MMVVLTFHVGAFTYFNTSKCSHASLKKPPKKITAVSVVLYVIRFHVLIIKIKAQHSALSKAIKNTEFK